ncbi:MAG: hypothetical protein ABR614_11805 [Mycobacteriales bacterium]
MVNVSWPGRTEGPVVPELQAVAVELGVVQGVPIVEVLTVQDLDPRPQLVEPALDPVPEDLADRRAQIVVVPRLSRDVAVLFGVGDDPDAAERTAGRPE